MTKSLIKKTVDILTALNHTPTKKFGQNFLIDQNVVEKFVRSADLQENDIIAEVGPGLGTVSEEILSYNTELHAVELDNRLFKFLNEKYADNPRFHIINADAVQYPAADIKNNCQDYKIVASLPYAISSAWFDAILSQKILPSTISVIIQLDAANRFLAEHDTKSFGPISIFIQSAYSKIAMYKISRNSFYPVPGVDSVMLFLQKQQNAFVFKKEIKNIIHLIFTNRRKQISKIAKDHNLNISHWLEKNNIPPNYRPEQIPLPAWQDLKTTNQS